MTQPQPNPPDCADCGKPISGSIYFDGRYPAFAPTFCESCYRDAVAESWQDLCEGREDFDPAKVPESWFVDPQPCQVCGRRVAFLDRRPGERRWMRHLCSPDCQREHENAPRRVTHEAKSCEVCGESFTPKRADAGTCSDRCRQAKRRARKENR